MKRTMSKIIAAALLLCLIMTVLVPALVFESSAAVSGSKRYNIMMVIDGSGSLETASKTDPDRMRYELIGDLLGILENDGHNIGAVVFSGYAGQSAADADMEQGIMLNTGMLSLDKMSPDGSPVKSYIENKVKEVGYDHTRNGTTDIGTALLVAERELEKAQKQNGLESLIFLFTDGVTDMKNAEQMQKSKENMNRATRAMNENGIRLMGAYLNKDGKLSSEEMKSIVCAANGITETSPEFSASYVEITNAAECHDAVNIIMRFLGNLEWTDGGGKTYVKSFEEHFTIPGIGVEEMNIRLHSKRGETLPNMEVKITQPDGKVIEGMELNALSRKSRTFQIYKLVAPMAGQWTISVILPSHNDIECVYSPIISMLVDAQISTTPDVSAFHGNMDVTFAGTLAQNGTTVTDAAAYREYNCQLMIQNRITGEKKDPIDIPNNNTGKFEHTMHLDEYGEFEAYIVFSCDEIEVVSPIISYKIQNTAPTVQSPVKVTSISGLFMSKTKQVDLSDCINDLEDGKNLTIAVKSATCSSDAFTLNGTDLEVVKKHIGKDTIELTVTDSAGEAATLQIQLRDYNVTIWFVLLFILIFIFILIIIFICILLRNKIRPKGELTVSFDLEVEGRIEPVVLTLAVPNVNAPSNTNLKKLMNSALLDDGQRLDCGLTASEIRTALRKIWDELGDVSVYKEVKRKGKKKEGAIGVKYGKKKKVLYDSAFTIYVEKQEFTLEFLLEREDDDPFSDGLGDDPMTSSGGGNDPFSDLFD